MSGGMHSHEEALRRALRAAADQIEPAADGLERIQARLYRPLAVPVAWLCAMWTRLSLRAPEGLWSAADRVAREYRLATERFLPAGGHRWPARLGWLRPALTMGVVVGFVTAVVYMAIEVPQAISPSGNQSALQKGQHPSGHNPGGGGGRGQASSSTGAFASGSGSNGGTVHAKTCAPGPSKLPVISPTKTPSSSPSNSPSQSNSPSPTPTATPTPTGSASPTPSSSGSSSPTGAVGSAATTGGPSAAAGASAAGAASHAPAAGKTTRSTARNSALQARQQAQPTSSPCPSSPRHSKRATASPQVSLGASGLLLPSLSVPQPANDPAEARARIY
jgi:hypothetical protein